MIDPDEIRRRVKVRSEDLAASPLPAGIIPLEIHCRWSSCRNGRHTLDHYNRGRRAGQYGAGHCQDCGAKIVDLPQAGDVMPLDDDQMRAAFAGFPRELIRAHYWKVPFDLRAYNQALRLGKVKLLEQARKRVLDAMTVDDAWSRRRAPYSGVVVAYAQHATATCCRQCASYWHGLPLQMSIQPSADQLEYVAWIAQAYLDLRFPNLPDEPTQGVPNVPKDAGPVALEVERMEDDLIDAFVNRSDPSGLVIPSASRMKLVASTDSLGGFLQPARIPLPSSGVA